MNKLIPVKVECHSGYKADEYPVCFYLDDEKFEIQEILDRWYQGDLNPEYPVANFFKVISGNEQYILKHDLGTGMWYVHT